MITIGELFAGIGGFSLAFHAAGARTAWFVEREPYCQQVLSKHWPDVPVYGDIYDCHELPPVDVITAGFPCQPFSVAGKQRGEQDERYLVPEMLRVIAEVQPYVVLLENVPGFASLTDGDTFKQLLGTLAEMGFDAQWGHLRASDVGAPHRRERWFCVAYRENIGTNWRHRVKTTNGESHPGGRGYSGNQSNGWHQDLEHPASTNGKTRRADSLGTEPTKESTRSSAYSGQQLGHARTPRLEVRHRRRPWHTQPAAVQSGARDAQFRLGGVTYGLSDWLDRPRWPARPGQPQHAWEPPRVVSAQAYRTARLKALGNAVVPQVVYPLACAIVAYLEGAATDEKTA